MSEQSLTLLVDTLQIIIDMIPAVWFFCITADKQMCDSTENLQKKTEKKTSPNTNKTAIV